MSILNPMNLAKPFKGFSTKIMILLLVAFGCGIFLMFGSIAGVGVLGAFHHIASTYHKQLVESSSSFVASDFEALLNASVRSQRELWQKQNLCQIDVAKARYGVSAWHWDFTNHQLNSISAESSVMMLPAEPGIPFRHLVQPGVDVIPAYSGYSLPRLPEKVCWNISRQVVGDKAAWLIWALPEGEVASGIWGFRIMQDQLRPQLVKLLRRLCTDNYMKIALVDQQKNVLMAVNHLGELKADSSLVAGDNQTFMEKQLGQVLDGLSMQVIYTPGLFGQIPDWGYEVMLIAIGLISLLLAGTIIYFYGLEKVSISQLKLQNDWVLNLAHSLRGPCHSLGVLTEAMKCNAAGDSEELYFLARRELEIMDSHCRQFLQFARKDMAANRFGVETVHLNSIIERAVERVLLRYPQVGKDCVEAKNLPEMKVSANAEAAEEALITLLDNALKYSPAKKQVQISVVKTDGGFSLSIVDHGLGISAEDLVMVGSAFYRSSRQNLEGINGTGIGLYLLREACSVMGWQLKIESDGPDKGTTATLIIPVAKK